MRAFAGFGWGIAVTVAAVVGGGIAYLKLGQLDVSAVPEPGLIERELAELAVDSSVEKRAPKQANPVALDDAVLLAAARQYEERCALCHGSMGARTLDLGGSFSPRAPNLIRHARGDSDGHVYWVIENGLRMTGMPAWGKHLSKEQIWSLVLLLKGVERLSPGLLAEWRKAAQ